MISAVQPSNEGAMPHESSHNSPRLSKRPSSPTTSPSSPKRARLSPATQSKTISPSSDPSPPVPDGPTQQNVESKSGRAAPDERSRSKRLFGSLLTTVAQPASSRVQKRAPQRRLSHPSNASQTSPKAQKLHEIERARQCDKEGEKLKVLTDDEQQEKDKKAALVKEKRRKAMKLVEEKGLKIKHANMRAMAGALRTEAEPRLYYKPWKLLEEQEDRIAEQEREVEEDIAKDWEDWRRKWGVQNNTYAANEDDARREDGDHHTEDSARADSKSVDATPKLGFGDQGPEEMKMSGRNENHRQASDKEDRGNEVCTQQDRGTQRRYDRQ